MKNFTNNSLKKELSLQVQSMKKISLIRNENTLKKLSKFLLAFLMFCTFSIQAKASHMMGADITYRLVSSTATTYTYEITLTLYRACEGATFLPGVYMATGGGIWLQTPLAYPPSGPDVEVTPVCSPPDVATKPITNCPGPNTPPVPPDNLKGVMRRIHKMTYVLQKNSGSYIFGYQECCRNGVSTITGAGASDLYVQCVFTTNDGYANSSPVFTNPPIPYWCKFSKQTFNHGAVDSFDNPYITINGIKVIRDSFAYSNYTPWTSQNTNVAQATVGNNPSVTFVGGITAKNFLHTTNGVKLDYRTGSITCTPSLIETAIMAIKVEEWRAIPAPGGGYTRVRIGHVTRDVQFTIAEQCKPIIDDGIIADSLIGSNKVSFDEVDICGRVSAEGVIKIVGAPGNDLKFENRTQYVHVPSPQAIANFRYTVNKQTTNGVDTLFIRYKLDSTLRDFGNEYFSFIVYYCTGTGIKISKTYSLVFHFTKSVRVRDPKLYYCRGGAAVRAYATGVDSGGAYTWYPTKGIIGASGPDSSWVDIVADSTRMYWVRGKSGIDSTTSCTVVDSLTVFSLEPFKYSITPTSATLCYNDTLKVKITPQITDTPYTFQWTEPFANSMYNPSTNQNSTKLQNPSIRAYGTGVYDVSITSRYKCTLKDKVTITVNGLRMNTDAKSARAVVCPGDTTKLWTEVKPTKVGLSFFPTLPNNVNLAMTPPVPALSYPGTSFSSLVPASAYPNPVGTFGVGGSSITRVIYTKADLLAMGATAGVIKSLSLDVVNNAASLDEFYINAAGVGTSLNATPDNIGSLFTVYNPKPVVINGGNNEFVFDNPLDWDGVSNLLFEFHAYKTTSILTPPSFSSMNVNGTTRSAFKFSSTAGVRAEAQPGAFTPTTGFSKSIPVLKLKMARIDSSSTTFLNTIWLPAANVTQLTNPIAIGNVNQIDSSFTAITGVPGCSDTSIIVVRPDTSFKVVGKGDTVICLSSGSTSIPLSATVTSSGPSTILWTSIPPDPSMTVTNQANITVSPTKGNWKYIVRASSLPCSAVDTVYVTVDDSLHVDLRIDSPKCTSNTGKLTAILPAASTPNKFNYIWSPNPSSSVNDTLKNVGAGIYTLSITLKSNPLCGGSVQKTIAPKTIVIPVNVLSSGVKCFGGTADSIYALASSTQSSGPYSYAWSGGGTGSKITNKPIGTYTVTVTDNITLCTGTSSFTLTQPQKLSVSASSVSVRCKGEQNGQVTSSVTGGTPYMTYLWTSVEGNNPNITTELGIDLLADSFHLVVTDFNGCKDSVGIRVNEPDQALSVAMSGVNATSVGGVDGKVYANTSGGNPNYSYKWSTGRNITGAPSLDSIVAGKGTYKVTVTDSKGCTTTGTQTIKDIDCNMETFIQVDSVACYGQSTGKIKVGTVDRINAATTSWYRYIITNADSVGFDSAQVASAYPAGSHTFSNLKSGLYNIQIKTNLGCDTIVTFLDLRENKEMNVTQTYEKDPSCKDYSDGEIHFSVGTDTFKPFTFMFDPAIGYIPDSFTKDRKSGKDQVVMIKDRIGCVKSVTYEIGTPNGITTSFVQTDSVSCFGMTNGGGKIDIVSETPMKPYIYSYKPGSDQNSSSNLVKNVGAINDSVVILYRCDTCNSSCRAVQNFSISQPAQLVLTTTSTDARCSYDLNGSITSKPTGGNGGENYSLKRIYNNSTVVPAQVSNLFNNLDSGKYKVYVTDRKGCIDSNIVVISKPDSFKVFLNVTDAPCPEVSKGKVNVDLILGGNVTSTYGYKWSKTNQGGQTSDAGTSTDIKNAQGLNIYKLILTDSKGCIATNSIFVDTQYTLQIASGVTTDANCYGATDGSARVTQMYPPSAPLPFTYNWSNQAQSNPIQAGKGNYTVTVTDGNGCMATGVYSIGQPEDILVQGKILHASCFNSNTGTIKINISGGHAPYVSQWATNPTQFTDSAIDLPAGTNSVVVTDAKGCVKNASFIVQQPTSLVAKMVDVNNITCFAASNGSMAVKVTGGVYKYHYAWNNVTSTDSAIKNLAPSQRYTVTVTDDNGCTTTASSAMTEPLKLEFEKIKVDSVSCPNYGDGSIDIYAKGGTISSTKQYEYSIDGGNTYVVGNKFPKLSAGIYNVSVRDNNNCVAIRKIEVGSPEELSIQAKRRVTDTMKLGGSDTIYFSRTTSSGIIPTINSVLWSPNNGLACANCESTQVTPYVTSEYLLEVRYHDNCLATSSIVVPVLPSMDIFIPSAFSPGNQDLVNDVLYVYGNGIKKVDFRIYNRWGEKVFESNSLKNGWDGKYKGEMAPTGIYTYQVQVEYLNGDKKNKQGSITLIR